MEQQIRLVATGWCESVEEYRHAASCITDRPGYIIDRDGSVTICFENSTTVALMNAGPVVLDGGRWLPAAPDADGRYVPILGANPVRAPYEYCSCKKYHGCQHYEMMGRKQLNALRSLLVELLRSHKMIFPYDNQLGDICPRAVAGGSGIYFASSYDQQRSDIHPQVDIINIIKSLATS